MKSNEKVLEEANRKLNNIKKKSAEKQKLKAWVQTPSVDIEIPYCQKIKLITFVPYFWYPLKTIIKRVSRGYF